MDAVITNALIITQDDERRIIPGGAVAVQGDRIVAVGPAGEVQAAHPGLPTVDARGKALLPGFINAHTHNVLLVLRGTVEDMTANVLYGYMTPVTFAMEPDERSALAAAGCLEAIRSGTTTLVDPLRHVATYAQAMADSGLRLYLSESCADALTLEIRNSGYTYDRAWGEAFLDRARALIEGFHGMDDGRVQVMVAAHATDNVSPWMLDQLTDLAERHGLRRTIHLAQGQGEVDQVRVAYERTPAEYLDDHGWLSPELLGAHWTGCTDADIALLAERGTHMVHCPHSGSRRGPNRSPIAKIRAAGVNIALGTDNMSEDMLAALHSGISIHRISHGGGTDLSPQVMLDTATRNGAAAIGRSADLGSIEVGKKADLTLVNINHPSMRPISNIVSNLVHYGHPGIVDSVMVDGHFLMQDGAILGVDEEAIVEESQRANDSIWERFGERFPDVGPRQVVTPLS